jgi:hypothetical protein
MRLLQLFCDVDDFCKLFTRWSQSQLLGQANKTGPKPKMAASEIMTIIIYFHIMRYRMRNWLHCRLSSNFELRFVSFHCDLN